MTQHKPRRIGWRGFLDPKKAARETVNCGRYWPRKGRKILACAQCQKPMLQTLKTAPWQPERRRFHLQHTLSRGLRMFIFRHLADWAFTRIFWLCLLGGTVQADVILWGQGGSMPPEVNTPYVIRPGESRTQQFFYKDPFEVHSLRLHVQDNPNSSGFGRVTVWLAGESIYSGPAVTSITGLSKRLDAGWHPLTVVGTDNQSQWVGSAGNLVGSTFKGSAAPGLNLYVSGMSLVPEPGAVVLLICCCAAGIFYAWRGRR